MAGKNALLMGGSTLSEPLSVSVIIPAYNCGKQLKRTLHGLTNQTFLPQEVIIVDSSSADDVYSVVCEWKNRLPILYEKVDFAYPGKARNIGVQMAKGDWLGFLDSKTVPNSTWLEESLAKAYETNSEMVTGLTFFHRGDSPFQKVLWTVSYGNKPHETLPGSIVRKESFLKCGGFLSNVRAGEDVEWRLRVEEKGIRQVALPEPLITYVGLSDSFLETIKKYYVYAMANAKINARASHKRLYFLLTLILMTFVVTKWNYFVDIFHFYQWLHIPHITKIYLGALVLMYVAFLISRPSNKSNVELEFLKKVYLFILFVLITGVIYKWNQSIAGWSESAAFYIPHITKIYLLSVIIVVLLFRGVVRPLLNDVSPSFLLPWRWFAVGLLGLALDIAKTPGYIWGATLEIGKLINIDRLFKKR